jgi:iron complex transport system ATP-binding protein
VLLQSSAVAFPFRVREVVTMGRAPWPASPQDAAAVEAALELLDLHHLADAPVTRLSGGEQARTALARVLAQDTPALLLDEPTAALDLRHAETALRHLAGLAAAGRTVVVVLHDLDLAAAHADRLVLVADGHVVADGPASAVLTGDVLTSAYGHPVEVLPHPRTGRPVVLPIR